MIDSNKVYSYLQLDFIPEANSRPGELRKSEWRLVENPKRDIHHLTPLFQGYTKVAVRNKNGKYILPNRVR